MSRLLICSICFYLPVGPKPGCESAPEDLGQCLCVLKGDVVHENKNYRTFSDYKIEALFEAFLVDLEQSQVA
jgi:hypothetical protein